MIAEGVMNVDQAVKKAEDTMTMILWLVFVVVTAGAGYWIYKRYAKNKNKKKNPPGTGAQVNEVEFLKLG